jgi:hypothetical protein
MNKLIVRTNDAPFTAIAGILAKWSKLAELVEQRITFPKGCNLEWELVFQHVSRETGWSVEKGTDYWEAFGMVRMVFRAYLGMFSDKLPYTNVPLTEVDAVIIHSDGVFWHSKKGKANPGDDMETIERLAEAVSKGKLPSGHHYRCNWIPAFDSSQE